MFRPQFELVGEGAAGGILEERAEWFCSVGPLYGSPLMTVALDHRIVDEIRLSRAEGEERFRRDMEEIDREYDRQLDRLHRTDRLSMVVVSLCAAAGLAVLVAAG
jgi:hypothetical protein